MFLFLKECSSQHVSETSGVYVFGPKQIILEIIGILIIYEKIMVGGSPAEDPYLICPLQIRFS